MNNDVALKILELLSIMDERISSIENSLEELSVDDFYFSSFGSDMQIIEEIKELVLENVKSSIE